MKQFTGTPAENGYFSMIYFPAAASANLLKMHLYAGLNHLHASQGKASANLYGDCMAGCIARDEQLSQAMAEFRDGKWKGMEMASHIGFVNWNDEDWRYPVRHVVTLPEKSRLVVSRADEKISYTNQYFPVPLEINDFLYPGNDSVTLEIANGGKGEICWHIDERCEYLEISACEGRTALTEEITVRVCRDKLPAGAEETFLFHVRSGHEFVPVVVRMAGTGTYDVPAGTAIAEEGICVLDATDYLEKTDGCMAGERTSFEELEDYGKYESGMKVFPVTEAYDTVTWKGAPSLTYGIYADTAGTYELHLHTSPANPLIYGGSLKLGISVNRQPVQCVTIVDETYRGGDPDCQKWCEGVLNQEHVADTAVALEAGMNYVTLYAGNTEIVLERLVFNRQGTSLKESYLGPKKSFRVL